MYEFINLDEYDKYEVFGKFGDTTIKPYSKSEDHKEDECGGTTIYAHVVHVHITCNGCCKCCKCCKGGCNNFKCCRQ